MERKPIFVVILSRFATNSTYREFRDYLENRLGKEYHVIVGRGRGRESRFQLFSDKEIKPIELENLKEILSISEKS